MPPSPKTQLARTKSEASLARDKSGCITCRVRQKKCTGFEPGQVNCNDCLRLNIQCLGVTHNRPDWLRNPEALKETKYRIKHHLTEYPVPRGRAPPTERPYLDFHDLIEKYSPRIPATEEYLSECRYRIQPESPTTSTHGGYLCVQPGYHGSPTTPSPTSPYDPMPRTPTDGGLFAPEIASYAYVGGVSPQEAYSAQPDLPFHATPYMTQFEGYGLVPQVQLPNPYLRPDAKGIFLTDPTAPSTHNLF